MAKDKFDSKKWFNSVDSIVEIKGKPINEVNSYYDLKQQYYNLSDNVEYGGIVSTLQDIKKKKDTDSFEKIGGIDRELRIWTDIQKLFNKSKLGRIL
tara:strand:+ start:1147 stop:1437 length:291 start_codon:yes stop_codon:yes gene_type:complete